MITWLFEENYHINFIGLFVEYGARTRRHCPTDQLHDENKVIM